MIDMPEPTKLALVGDSHGDLYFMERVIEEAYEAGVDTLFQLGDFGYWPPAHIIDRKHPKDHFLDGLDLWLTLSDMRLYWIDGNHEAHNRLEPGMSTVRTQHIPRGHRWRWWGKDWMGVGGGVSVDKKRRTEGYDWFPEEELTSGQLTDCLRDGNVDIVLAHDAPPGVPGLKPWLFPAESIAESDGHQRVMATICDMKMPELWIHGHYHVAYTSERMATTVRGLASNIEVNGSVMYMTADDLLH